MSDDREGLAGQFAGHMQALTRETLSGATGDQTVGPAGLAALEWMFACRTAIEAALRASPDRDEGERVREACARRAEFWRCTDGPMSNADRRQDNVASGIAAEIRALRLPLAQEEKP